MMSSAQAFAPLSIYCLPLSSPIKENLEACGLLFKRDLAGLTAEELQRITSLSIVNCKEILACVNGPPPPILDCLTKLSIELSDANYPITTLCDGLDSALGDGIPFGKITEIYGEAGTGKTQLCFQLAVNVQIPLKYGGAGGEALFIDNEGTFTPKRLKEIADHTVNHVNATMGSQPDVEADRSFTATSAMDRVYFRRCESGPEFCVLISKLDEFLDEHPRVRLLIIDSIAYPFRFDSEEDFREKTRKLMCIGQQLKLLAVHRRLAVVVVNQVTQKPDSVEAVAALGASWSHHPGIKLELRKHGADRVAVLRKSLSNYGIETKFTITSAGIRD